MDETKATTSAEKSAVQPAAQETESGEAKKDPQGAVPEYKQNPLL